MVFALTLLVLVPNNSVNPHPNYHVWADVDPPVVVNYAVRF